MGFLERIRDIATSRNKSGSKDPPHKPARQTPSKDQESEPEHRGTLNTDDMPGPSSVQERLDRLTTLTPREQEVYRHLIRGRTMKETARLLGVTYATVNFHCQGLYRKLCINTRAQLFMRYAMLDTDDIKNRGGDG